MRLIDADELDMYDCLKSYYGDAWRDAQEEIENAPTVEAIPVKWLTDRFCNHRTIHTEKSMMREVYLKEIIRMWRKENESNTCD